MTYVGAMVIDSTHTKLKDQALRALNQLPPFSPILGTLIATLAGESVSFQQVAVQIEKDTVLAGTVLRMVNSAMYGRRGNISSVRHAVALIGLDRLRNVALSLSISQLWARARAARRWPASQFNLHGVATAILADTIAQNTQVNYPEGAFVAGLLHDVGKLLIAVGLPSEFEQVLDMVEHTGREWSACEDAVLGFHHAELSGLVMERWNLPLEVQRAVTHHHESFAFGLPLPLASVIATADLTVNQMGLTLFPGKGTPPPEKIETLAPLGLGDREPYIIVNFQSEFEAIRSYC
ncbi:MAG: HDOD domain-containing protein [Acidobacteriales bacterium]|nr:HDOD domain-containing protein [Terriglobales bacterium]